MTLGDTSTTHQCHGVYDSVLDSELLTAASRRCRVGVVVFLELVFAIITDNNNLSTVGGDVVTMVKLIGSKSFLWHSN